MLFELVEVNQVGAAAVLPVFDMMYRWVAKVIERGFEGPGDFKRIDLQVVGVGDGADKGNNMIAIYRIEIIQTSQHVYVRSRNS